ncbi:hypothetical protein M5K25_010949 [Dendrobium thyrsiflorum]|uniref:SWIM-type domain-containing protein n=1 Tax=Dendrobium thyrsiflorum TaxID=117978 RepID=A0ABD0V1R3_DENTH
MHVLKKQEILVDIIRAMLMEQRSQRKINSYSWKGPLVPHVEEYIRDITTRKEHLIICQLTATRAEVEGLYGRHEVDIEKKECTCGFWQLSGLPCIYSDAYIGTRQHTLWHTMLMIITTHIGLLLALFNFPYGFSYLILFYLLTIYKMACDGAISTIPGKDLWAAVSDGEVVTTPSSLRPCGRPKKRRIKYFLDIGKKSKLGHICSRCNLWGHHKSTCKNPLNVHGDEIDNEIAFDDEPPTTSTSRAKLTIRRPSTMPLE